MDKMLRHLLFLTLLFPAVALLAQPVGCISFDDIQTDATFSDETGYPAGTLIYSEDGIDVSTGAFIPGNLNGQILYGNLNAIDYGINNLDFPYLFINYATAVFDFPAHPNYEQAHQVCFNYYPSGHEVNLGINGQVGVFNSFSQASPFYPGFDIVVQPSSEPAQPLEVCITGNIEEIALGGIEFALDDICYTFINPNLDCTFNNIEATPICVSTDQINLQLNFAPNGVENEFFDVYINDEFHSFHAFENLPVSVQNISPVGEQEVVFVTICENDNPNCCTGFDLVLPNSCPCELGEMVVGQYPCNANSGNYFLYLDFEYNELVGDSFALQGNGINYGTFAYGALPLLELEVFGEPGDLLEFVAIDLETDLCETFTTFTLGSCDDACNSFEAVTDLGACQNTGTVDLYISVSSPPLGQVITVQGTQSNFFAEVVLEDQSTFRLDWPTEIGQDLLVIADQLTACATEVEIEISPTLCQACEIFNVNIEPTPCNPNNVYSLFIDFDYNLPDGEFFVNIANENYGPFSLEDFPMTIGSIVADNSNAVAVTIYEVDNNCWYSETIQNACAPDCSEYFEIVQVWCFEDTPLMQLAVSAPNPNAEGFLVVIDNQELFYAYGEPQYTIALPPNTTSIFQLVTIYSDAANPEAGCSVSYNITNPCACDIQEVDISTTECDPSTGTYYVRVAFSAFSVVPEPAFLVQVGEEVDTVYGTEHVLEYGPFQQGNTGIPVAIYGQFDQCFYETLYQPDCTSDICQINDLFVEPFCEAGELYLEVGFVATGGDGVYRIRLNGIIVAVTEDPDPVFLLGPYNNLPNPSQIIVEQVNGECIEDISFEYEPCNNNECGISNVQAGPVEVSCASDNFYVRVDFDYTIGNGIVIVEVLNEEFFVDTNEGGPYFFGPYGISDVPDFFEVTVTQQGNDDCSDADGVFAPDCPPNCEIFDLVIEGTQCDNNGDYQIEVYFESNLENGFFDVWNQTTGDRDTISLEEVPFLMPTLNINEVEGSVFRIAAIGFNGCVAEASFVQECNGGCEIWDLVIEGTGCDNEGNYQIVVDFETNYTGPFQVTNDATGDIEFISAANLPLVMDPINFGEIQTSVITIEAIGGNCFAQESYVHDCPVSDECIFFDLFAEPYACDGDQFLVDVAFDNAWGNELGFYIFADGMIFGPFQYGETFYTVGPLNGSEEDHDILVLDIVDPSCFASYEFSFLCGDECMIQSVVAEPLACDGEVFWVELDVEAQNTGETFTVVGNGNNYGTFSYEELPITIGPLEGDANTVYEFGVIDLAHPNCTNFTVIEPVNCLPCEIGGLEYDISCGEDTYELTINFEYVNPESDYFVLQIGNQFVEEFLYTSLPISIDLPLDYNGPTIRVEDAVNELCGQTIDFEVPCCFLLFNDEAVSASDCQNDGTFYIEVGEPIGINTSENLVVTYAPAGSSIVETVVIPYSQLPAEVGPVEGNGQTSYYVLLSDQNYDCAQAFTIEPIYCDNTDCVEFEAFEGIYGPITGYDPGDLIGTENGVAITYESQTPNCATCNVFAIDQSTLNVNFGSGQVMSLESAGIGFGFANASLANVVSIDYYFVGESMSLIVNDGDLITVDNPLSFPSNVAPGVTLEVIPSLNDGSLGTFVFSGNLQSLVFYSDGASAFDNLCGEFEEPTPSNYCLELPFSSDFMMLAAQNSADAVIYEDDIFIIESEGYFDLQFNETFYGVVVTQPLNQGCSPSNINLLAEERNMMFSFPNTGNNGTVFFNWVSSDSINFRVGSNALTPYFLPQEIPTNPAPGITVSVEVDPNDPNSGSMTIHGDLSSFTIGGIRFCLWDLCISQEENVWPGDTNADNVAGHFDLLNVGLTYGFTGPERPSNANDWAAFISQDWDGAFIDGLNHKHADANGDGVVNEQDRDVIEQNYNLTHGPVDGFEPLPYTEVDPPIYVDLSEIGELPNGSIFEIPIVVGTEEQEIIDIYGVAFTVVIDPEVIDPSSLEVVYPTSWMGEPGVNLISLHHIDANGRLEVALSRTDHNNVSGHGPVMYIRGIIDDIAGYETTDLGLENVKAVNHNEYLIALRPNGGVLQITKETEPFDRDMLRHTFRTYPNPTSGTIYFSNMYDYSPEKVEVYAASGQLVQHLDDPGMEISLARLPAGIYFVKLHLHGFIFTERIVKIER